MAIPTKYAGVQFRSRLEARWAAFFDLVGWRWEYEPVDLDGWIPDFVLMGKSRPVYVEVKPILWGEDDVSMTQAASEVKKAVPPPHRETIVLGASFPALSRWGHPLLGVVIQNGWFEERSEFKGETVVHREPAGLWLTRTGTLDWSPVSDGYLLRISGEVGAVEIPPAAIVASWREAGNVVQWRAPR